MCSSVSTSSACGLSLLVVAAFLAGGCSCGRSRPVAVTPPPVRGHADLDVLVRRHPGWKGVSQFDQALARLSDAAAHPAPALALDQSLGGLPPIDAAPPPAPAPALDAERRRLSGVERTQVARLRARLARNRGRQLAQEREAWQKEAQKAYVQTVAAAQSAYAQQVARLTAERDARRVNLVLQIRALEKIVTGWDNSVPPTPELNRAKAELAQKRAALAALDSSRGGALVEARTARDDALARARREREASVQAQALAREASLKAQDEGQIASFGAELSAQRLSLLRAAQSLRSAPVPAAGGLGPEALPADAEECGGPAETKLREARSKLEAQRARWIAFLYDDTRAAALDVAGRRRWIVSFGPGPSAGADLTAPMAQALTATVWKG